MSELKLTMLGLIESSVNNGPGIRSVILLKDECERFEPYGYALNLDSIIQKLENLCLNKKVTFSTNQAYELDAFEVLAEQLKKRGYEIFIQSLEKFDDENSAFPEFLEDGYWYQKYDNSPSLAFYDSLKIETLMNEEVKSNRFMSKLREPKKNVGLGTSTALISGSMFFGANAFYEVVGQFDGALEILNQMDLTMILENVSQLDPSSLIGISLLVPGLAIPISQGITKFKPKKKNKRIKASTLTNASSKFSNIGISQHRKYLFSEVVPDKYVQLHEKGMIHIHALEFYDTGINSLGLDVKSLIGDGAYTFHHAIRELFRQLVRLTNQLSGGIGIMNFEIDMALYLNQETDDEIRLILNDFFIDLNTPVRYGSESPFITLNFGVGTRESEQRLTRLVLEAFELGNQGRLFIFPNLVFKLKKEINVDSMSPNFHLLQLAQRVAASRMNPTFYNTDNELVGHFDPLEIGIMCCRNQTLANKFGQVGAFKRGNISVVTMNLVHLALDAKGDEKKFLESLSGLIKDCKDLLKHRLNILSQANDNSFFSNQALFLEFDDRYSILKHFTLSVGYIGLWETSRVLYPDTRDNLLEMKEKSMALLTFINEEVHKETKLNFNLIGTSAENVSGRFPIMDEEKFGKVTGITDKGYYTNSFHVPVSEPLGVFHKIKYESDFHLLSDGGSITYVEMNEALSKNLEAMSDLVNFAHRNGISYFGINFPLDVCENNHEGIFETFCSICGSEQIKRYRRVSGYISELNTFTVGKSAEEKDRQAHSLKNQKSSSV